MTDIVDRLRSIDMSWNETGEWCAEAADEIERLRINLRDHFATAALSSMLSHPQNMSEGTPALAAEWAYKFADAMLEHRTALGEGK